MTRRTTCKSASRWMWTSGRGLVRNEECAHSRAREVGICTTEEAQKFREERCWDSRRKTGVEAQGVQRSAPARVDINNVEEISPNCKSRLVALGQK